jgi:putative ABC transport system permease protein
MVADFQTGFRIGERARMGNFDYMVIRLTKNIVAYTADPVIYVSLDDAQEIIFELDPDLLRNQRARLRRQVAGLRAIQPALLHLAEEGGLRDMAQHRAATGTQRVLASSPIRRRKNEETNSEHRCMCVACAWFCRGRELQR